MKTIYLKLLLAFMLLMQVSCTMRIPLTRNVQKVHDGGEKVQPYFSVKKKTIGGYGALFSLGGIGLGAYMYTLTKAEDGTALTAEQLVYNKKYGSYLAIGGIGLGVISYLVRKPKISEEGVTTKNFDSWLAKYGNKNNTTYKLLEKDNYSYLILPKNNVKAYEAEEKRIKDEAERQRLLAERRKREQEEKVVYDRIMEGKEEALDSYLSQYKDGVYYNRVLEISKSYPIYRKAKKGKLQDVRNYLSDASNKFRRDEIERKLANIESFQRFALEREKALGQVFGLNTTINTALAQKNLTDLSKKNDFMSSLWLDMFNELGITQTTSQRGNLIDKIAKTAFLDVMNADDGLETLFYWSLYNSLISNSAESQRNGLKMIKTFADDNHPISNYIYGLINYQNQNYGDAITYFENAQRLGIIKAKTGLGIIYANKKYELYNKKKAIDYFTQSFEGGDGDASFKMAQLYLSTMQDVEDQQLAVDWATKSFEKGNTGAMIFLGKVYSETKNGIKKDPEKVLYYFNKAASLGDVEAIFGLGLMYLDGDVLDMKDQNKGLEYLKLASQKGKSKAMVIMAKLYDEGNLLPKSEIKARYWYNKALKYGEGKGASNTEIESPLSTIFRLGDFSPSYTVTVNAYTGQEISRTQDFGSGLMGGLMSGMIGGWFERYANQQRTINGSELVETLDNKTIYAATLTSYAKSPIYLKSGSKITFTTTGNVSFGFFSGGGSANGIGGWAEYSITPRIAHGAVIWRVNGGEWKLAGTKTSWEPAYINAEGYVELAINDRDNSNNQGYFDVVIEVEQ